MELRYFREVTGREVDFVVTHKNLPMMFIECKLSDDPINPALIHLKNRFPDVAGYQISLKGKKRLYEW